MMHSSLANLAHDFKVCKVRVDTNGELAAHYGVSPIAALVIFNNGKEVARDLGVASEASPGPIWSDLPSRRADACHIPDTCI